MSWADKYENKQAAPVTQVWEDIQDTHTWRQEPQGTFRFTLSTLKSTSLCTAKSGGTDSDFMVHSCAPSKLGNQFSNGHRGLKHESFYFCLSILFFSIFLCWPTSVTTSLFFRYWIFNNQMTKILTTSIYFYRQILKILLKNTSHQIIIMKLNHVLVQQVPMYLWHHFKVVSLQHFLNN